MQARRLETETLRDAWLATIDIEQLEQGGTPATSMTMSSTATTMTAPTTAQGHD